MTEKGTPSSPADARTSCDSSEPVDPHSILDLLESVSPERISFRGIPLLEGALEEPLPEGSSLIALYDSGSLWYNASLTITSAWLATGGTVSYYGSAQPTAKIREQLNRLGLRAEEFERNGKLVLWDWYTPTLGRKSNEKFSMDSLKVADLSIWWSQHSMTGPPSPDLLTIIDDLSCLSRFNDERAFAEFTLARVIPTGSLMKSVVFTGIIRDVHSDWVYKRLEAAVDGTIEFRLFEVRVEEMKHYTDTGMRSGVFGSSHNVEGFSSAGQEIRDMMRIRNMREVAFSSKWHMLKFDKNSGVSILPQ